MFSCDSFAGVGKSCLLLRYSDNTFSENFIATIGVDYRIRTLEVEGERVKVQIWDTAGQERFRTITKTYYRGSHGIVVVYDVCNGDTFANVKRWLNEIDQNCDVVSRILVGNKDDDPVRKIVDPNDARSFAAQMGIELYETSAKLNKNVDEMFFEITRQMLQIRKQQQHKQHQQQQQQRESDIIVPTAYTKTANKRKKSCCK